MKITPLETVLTENKSQSRFADLVGVHQTAISKANRENRNIFVIEDEKGVSAFEIKPVFNTSPNLEIISDCLLKQLETT